MTSDLSRATADEIRRLLDDRGWSQRELARRSGLGQSNLTRKLSGARQFDIDELGQVSRALDVKLSDLLATVAPR